MQASLCAVETRQLVQRMKGQLGAEREVLLEFLLHLVEFDRRRGYLEYHRNSLWEFCEHDLHLEDHANFNRTTTVRVIRRFPQVIEFLRDGRLSMSAVVAMKDVLRDDATANRLFEDAAGKSKSQVEKLVAGMKAPIVNTEAKVTKLPPAPVIEPSPVVAELRAGEIAAAAAASTDAVPEPPSQPLPAGPVLLLVHPTQRHDDVRPVSADQYRITMIVDSEFMNTVERARNASSHAIPDGNLQAVILRGLEALITKAGKRTGTIPVRGTKRQTVTEVADTRSASGAGASHERAHAARQSKRDHISRDLVRAVFERDGDACVWKQPGGNACGSKHQLELDHVRPVALGGETVLSNLRVLCHAHNQQAAREAFGEAFMSKFSKRDAPD